MAKIEHTVSAKKNSASEREQIELTPYLISCDWNSRVAYAGQKVFFEVYTTFVGHPAPTTGKDGKLTEAKPNIKIVCYSESGKTVGTVEDVIKNDHYLGFFDVPTTLDPQDRIYFEVELLGLSLSGRSGFIPVFFRPGVNSLQWSVDEVEQGDILTLSADLVSVADATEVTLKIYEYDDKQAHNCIAQIPTSVKAQRVEVEWEFKLERSINSLLSLEENGEEGTGFCPIKMFFTVALGTQEYGCEGQDSGFVTYIPKVVRVLEFEGDFFYPGSAVFLPDRLDGQRIAEAGLIATSGFSVMRALLIYAALNNARKLFLTGHVDGSGASKDDFRLAKDRANSLGFIVANQKDDWVQMVRKGHVVEDIQHLLTWDGYDPGVVDGKLGKRTKRAIKAFQKANGLGADGKFGRKTWGAMFDRCQARFESFVENDEAGEQALNNRDSVNWLSADQKAHGCGALFATADFENEKFRTKSSGRLEALFFDENALPAGSCGDGVCVRSDCIIYHPPIKYARQIIEPDGAEFRRRVSVKFSL